MASFWMTLTDHSYVEYIIPCYCLSGIVAITTARLIPASRARFLRYGARGSPVSSTARLQVQKKPGINSRWLDWLASLDVPHSWFMHFYLLSLSVSLFWFFQIAQKGKIIILVSRFMPSQQSTISAEVSLLCVLLMIFQSGRRLWECFSLSRGSTSRMWIGHYLFGLTFYLATNVAVWIEGVDAISRRDSFQLDWTILTKRQHVAVGLLIFMTATAAQSVAHVYLASLKKYTVPSHWLFRQVVAPHYTAECGIYLGLSVIAAPNQHLLNRTLLWIVFLTTVNLGITSADTKEWMIHKFPEHRSNIRAMDCMIPGVW